MALTPFRYRLPQLPYEIGTISSPLLRMRKARHRGIKYLPPKSHSQPNIKLQIRFELSQDILYKAKSQVDFLHWVVCLASVCSALSLLICFKMFKTPGQTAAPAVTGSELHTATVTKWDSHSAAVRAGCTWMAVTPPPYLRQNANVAHAKKNYC